MDFIVTKKPISSIGGHRCFEMYKIRYSGSNTFKCLKALTYTKFLKSVLVVLNLKNIIKLFQKLAGKCAKMREKIMMALLDIHFGPTTPHLYSSKYMYNTLYVQYTKPCHPPLPHPQQDLRQRGAGLHHHGHPERAHCRAAVPPHRRRAGRHHRGAGRGRQWHHGL